MAEINGCDLPEDLYYLVEKHVWARPEPDGTVRIGLTDVAQGLAKTFLVARPKAVGRTLKKEQSAGTVESGKFVGPVLSPVSGEIVAVNEALAATPSLVNDDPYGAGWFLLLRPIDWDGERTGLASGPEGLEQYREFLVAKGISCE